MRDLASVRGGVGGLALGWLGIIYRQRTIAMHPIPDIVISKHSLYMIPNQPKAKPPTPPPTLARSRTYTSSLHPLYPLQMHVYLIDKFSFYNLKMANIYGRNM